MALRFVFVNASGRHFREMYWYIEFQYLPSSDRPGTLQKGQEGAGTASKKCCSKELKEMAVIDEATAPLSPFSSRKQEARLGVDHFKFVSTQASLHDETGKKY